jgi:beta-galactosidase
MVRQHYNHPSILLWGSMNEIFLNDAFNNRTQKITDSSYGQEARRFAEMLDKYIRTEDSNRVSTLAMHMSSDYDKYKIDVVPEVASYNVYSGWYSGKVDEFGKTFDNKHASKPKLSIFISEYGAESDRSLNTETPIRLDNTGQYQRYFHESYLQQIKARTYLSGSAIWNQFDFGNPNIGGTMSNINHKGMYTWDRQPKDVYFFYKANWNPSPMIYIASRDWRDRAGAIGDSSTIEVYTNGKDATLLLNKKNIGTKKINSINKIKWRVVLVDGVNELIAKTKIKGEVVADTFYLNYHGYSKKIADNSSFNSLLINIGSNAQYIDNQKNIWLEDRPYKKGSFGYIGGKPSFIYLKGKITNTDKTPLLYSYLDSISIYQIDVPNGQYQIELFFAEPEFHEQDKRVFNVNVNGSSVINHIDLNKEASYVEAVSKTLNVTAKDNQGIQITFDAIKGNPILNALRITRQ